MIRATLVVVYLFLLTVATPQLQTNDYRQPFGVKMCMELCESLDDCNSPTFMKRDLTCDLGKVLRSSSSAGVRLKTDRHNTTGKHDRVILSRTKGYVKVEQRKKKGCPKGYEFLKLGQTKICVRYHEERKNWSEALSICQTEGDMLAKPDNTRKQILLGRVLAAHSCAQSWIGVRYQHMKKHWIWDDGTLCTNPWCTTIPSAKRGISILLDSVGFVDRPSSTRHTFVCEFNNL